MNPVISVILPTVRPHLIKKAMDSIGLAAAHVPCQTVVVADFGAEALGCFDHVHHYNCTWIERPRAGVMDAILAGMNYARGEYIFSFNDESVLGKDALAILHREAVANPRQILTPRHEPYYNFVYYDRIFAPFPFASRALLDELGGVVDPIYKAFAADPDLSLRGYAKGVPTRIVEDAVIYHSNNADGVDAVHQHNVNTYLHDDRENFKRRWAHLGEFKDP